MDESQKKCNSTFPDVGWTFVNENTFEDPFSVYLDDCKLTEEKDKFEVKHQIKLNESAITQKKDQRKRGRIRKGERVHVYHSKNRRDNIRNKLTIHFMNFLVEFTNGLVKGGLYNINNSIFRKLSHTSKTKNQKNIFKTGTIQDMLSMEISSKYRMSSSYNKKTMTRILKYLEKKNSYSMFINYINTPIKQFFNEIYLSKEYEKVLEKYQINKKKGKISFFEQFLQTLKLKYNDDHYIGSLEKEVKLF